MEKSVNMDTESIEAVVDALMTRVPLVAEYLASAGLEVAYRRTTSVTMSELKRD